MGVTSHTLNPVWVWTVMIPLMYWIDLVFNGYALDWTALTDVFILLFSPAMFQLIPSYKLG